MLPFRRAVMYVPLFEVSLAHSSECNGAKRSGGISTISAWALRLVKC